MVRPSNCISFANGSISQPRQTGAPSLLLTLLILPTSPKAAFFFQGTLGSFMAYSQIGGAASAGGSPGPQGQAPGSYTPPAPARESQSSASPSLPEYRAAMPSSGPSSAPSVSPGTMAQAPTSSDMKRSRDDVPPILSSASVWSPIPYPEEIGREETFY
ncbi:hypothetical protein EIQ01_00035 [Xanthomonas campestris pv. raphani]